MAPIYTTLLIATAAIVAFASRDSVSVHGGQPAHARSPTLKRSLKDCASQVHLEPEVTQGPYYVNGELVRSDVREDQEGVDLYADVQIIDVNTCEPVNFLDL
uniref:Pectate lyase n=1 Tax=Phytophthora ramorum TaxID=164328 RepID=H3H631_PHYRM